LFSSLLQAKTRRQDNNNDDDVIENDNTDDDDEDDEFLLNPTEDDSTTFADNFATVNSCVRTVSGRSASKVTMEQLLNAVLADDVLELIASKLKEAR
jgi:hypothetical protein